MGIESISNNSVSGFKYGSQSQGLNITPQPSVQLVSRTEEVSNNRQESNNKDNSKDEAMAKRQLDDVSPEKVKNAINDINQKIKPTNTECAFSYHEETHRISITVKDKNTQEVIKEIPPEKTLDMIARVWEIAGLLVDEKR